ncbi:MAG: hypothetical protein ABEK59_08820 [Halobacteria archaeon]
MAQQELTIVQSFLKVVREVINRGSDMLHGSMQDLLAFTVEITVRTPYPMPKNGFFFGAPKTEPWVSIYEYYSSVIFPITVVMIATALALIMFTGIFGRFLSGYERSRAKRRFFMGFLFILVWWGIGGFTLRIADLFALAVAPDSAEVAGLLAEGMSIDGMNLALSAVFTFIETGVILSVVFVYLVRWVAIYSLMLGMPVIVALWIVDVGPFAYLSEIAGGLGLKFIPLAFVTIPISIIYRVAGLFFETLDMSSMFSNSVGPFVFSLGFPLLTLFTAYIVFFRGGRVIEITGGETQVVTSPQVGETSSGGEEIFKGRPAETQEIQRSGGGQGGGGVPDRQDVYSGRRGVQGSSGGGGDVGNLYRSRSKVKEIQSE